MSTPIDLSRLGDFFEPEDIEWRLIAASKKTNKGLVAPYLDNRAIMDRLDTVCGPAGWKNEFSPGPDGGVVCGISVYVTHADGASEWITKWDGAQNTDIHPVKGGLTTSMRRAAVHWNIGRYLYRIPNQWVPLDERGQPARTPTLPAEFLPPHRRNETPKPAAPPAHRAPSHGRKQPTASGNGQAKKARPNGNAEEFFMPGS